MAFFTSAVGTLQTLVIALGAGLGIWVLSLMDDEDAEAYTAEKEAAAQAELERKQAEEEAKKAEEAAASGAEQPKENKVTKYAATFLGVLALVGLAAGGGIYAFMKQKQKKQAEKEVTIMKLCRQSACI